MFSTGTIIFCISVVVIGVVAYLDLRLFEYRLEKRRRKFADLMERKRLNTEK